MGEGVKDGLWIRSLLKELSYPQDATRILNDNQSALKLVLNPEFHRRTKHIEVKEHFLREKQENEEIAVEYIPTEDQPADMMTKHLTEAKLTGCKRSANIMPLKLLLCLTMMLGLASTGTAIFHTTPPILWKESAEKVIVGGVGFNYQLEMDPGCDKFGSDPATKTWCDQIYLRYVYSALTDKCIGKVDRHVRGKRFEPVTMAVIGIAGVVAASSGSLAIWNRVSIKSLQTQLDERMTGVMDILDDINDEVKSLREQLVENRNDMIRRYGLSLSASEYSAVTVHLAGQMRRMLIAFNQKIIKEESLAFLNITLPPNVPVESLVPVSCDWDETKRLMDLRFYGKVASSDQILLDAIPFTLYARHDGEVCVTEYTGSKRMMFDNRSNTSCKVSMVNNDGMYLATREESCARPKDMWTARGCAPQSHFSAQDVVQVKELGYGIYVYCNGYDIEIHETRVACPDTVFTLTINSTFAVAGRRYDYTGHVMPTVVTPELLSIWQQSVNVHMEPEVNPYEINSKHEMIRRKIDNERHQLTQTIVFGTTTFVLLIAFIIGVFIVRNMFKKENLPPRSHVYEMMRVRRNRRRTYSDVTDVRPVRPVPAKRHAIESRPSGSVGNTHGAGAPDARMDVYLDPAELEQ